MARTVPLTDQHVVVTGGARGIGLATATEFRRRGARVTIGDVDAEACKRAADELGPDVLGLHVDVSSPDSFGAFLDDARREVGEVDVLVNNAGIMPIGPFLDLDADLERRACEINLLGVLTGMRAALGPMSARGRGHVVNIASVAGRSPVPGGITYCATKAAVIHATEAARVEFGGRGVHFTCVQPSFTRTELIDGTPGVRLVPTVEPTDVARAVADAVERRRKTVVVPRSMSPLLVSGVLMGRRMRDWSNRRFGAYDTFLEIDARARRAYQERIERS